MELKLKYGDGFLKAELPLSEVKELRPLKVKGTENIKSLLLDRLDNPLESPPLKTLVSKGDRVVIAVSDITRIWNRTRDYLSHLIEYLLEAGIEKKDLTLIIARGCHRPNSPAEIREIVGEEIYRNYTIRQHDPDDSDNLVYVGTTRRNNDIYLNREAVQADKLILTGGIVYHAMSGFGGGRKSILPGLAGRETVTTNHLHVLHPEKIGINPAIGSNKLEGNPIHEDMMEAAGFINPDFLVNVVINQDDQIIDFFIGHWQKAWEKGCELINSLYGVEIKERVELVIASCGGYPQDISLYQASKTFYNAGQASREGGVIIVAAEARDGAGSDDFFNWFKYKSPEEYYQNLKKGFTIPGYLAFLIYMMARTRQVYLLTEVDEPQVRKMGITPVSSLQEAVDIALAYLSRDKKELKALVLPEGGFTLPVLENNYKEGNN